VPVTFEGFMFVLPHAEAIVGLRIAIFQVANHNLLAGQLRLPKTSSRSTSHRINNIPVDLLWWE
jgi:hypothetical protein